MMKIIIGVLLGIIICGAWFLWKVLDELTGWK
jgi:hypothetical protein